MVSLIRVGPLDVLHQPVLHDSHQVHGDRGITGFDPCRQPFRLIDKMAMLDFMVAPSFIVMFAHQLLFIIEVS